MLRDQLMNVLVGDRDDGDLIRTQQPDLRGLGKAQVMDYTTEAGAVIH